LSGSYSKITVVADTGEKTGESYKVTETTFLIAASGFTINK